MEDRASTNSATKADILYKRKMKAYLIHHKKLYEILINRISDVFNHFSQCGILDTNKISEIQREFKASYQQIQYLLEHFTSNEKFWNELLECLTNKVGSPELANDMKRSLEEGVVPAAENEDEFLHSTPDDNKWSLSKSSDEMLESNIPEQVSHFRKLVANYYVQEAARRASFIPKRHGKPLDDLYVNPLFSRRVQGQTESTSMNAYNILTFIVDKEFDTTVVVGCAGAGKTAVRKMLALRFAEATLESCPTNAEAKTQSNNSRICDPLLHNFSLLLTVDCKIFQQEKMTIQMLVRRILKHLQASCNSTCSGCFLTDTTIIDSPTLEVVFMWILAHKQNVLIVLDNYESYFDVCKKESFSKELNNHLYTVDGNSGFRIVLLTRPHILSLKQLMCNSFQHLEITGLSLKADNPATGKMGPPGAWTIEKLWTVKTPEQRNALLSFSPFFHAWRDYVTVHEANPSLQELSRLCCLAISESSNVKYGSLEYSEANFDIGELAFNVLSKNGVGAFNASTYIKNYKHSAAPLAYLATGFLTTAPTPTGKWCLKFINPTIMTYLAIKCFSRSNNLDLQTGSQFVVTVEKCLKRAAEKLVEQTTLAADDNSGVQELKDCQNFALPLQLLLSNTDFKDAERISKTLHDYVFDDKLKEWQKVILMCMILNVQGLLSDCANIAARKNLDAIWDRIKGYFSDGSFRPLDVAISLAGGRQRAVEKVLSTYVILGGYIKVFTLQINGSFMELTCCSTKDYKDFSDMRHNLLLAKEGGTASTDNCRNKFLVRTFHFYGSLLSLLGLFRDVEISSESGIIEFDISQSAHCGQSHQLIKNCSAKALAAQLVDTLNRQYELKVQLVNGRPFEEDQSIHMQNSFFELMAITQTEAKLDLEVGSLDAQLAFWHAKTKLFAFWGSPFALGSILQTLDIISTDMFAVCLKGTVGETFTFWWSQYPRAKSFPIAATGDKKYGYFVQEVKVDETNTEFILALEISEAAAIPPPNPAITLGGKLFAFSGKLASLFDFYFRYVYSSPAAPQLVHFDIMDDCCFSDISHKAKDYIAEFCQTNHESTACFAKTFFLKREAKKLTEAGCTISLVCEDLSTSTPKAPTTPLQVSGQEHIAFYGSTAGFATIFKLASSGNISIREIFVNITPQLERGVLIQAAGGFEAFGCQSTCTTGSYTRTEFSSTSKTNKNTILLLYCDNFLLTTTTSDHDAEIAEISSLFQSSTYIWYQGCLIGLLAVLRLVSHDVTWTHMSAQLSDKYPDSVITLRHRLMWTEMSGQRFCYLLIDALVRTEDPWNDKPILTFVKDVFTGAAQGHQNSAVEITDEDATHLAGVDVFEFQGSLEALIAYVYRIGGKVACSDKTFSSTVKIEKIFSEELQSANSRFHLLNYALLHEMKMVTSPEWMLTNYAELQQPLTMMASPEWTCYALVTGGDPSPETVAVLLYCTDEKACGVNVFSSSSKADKKQISPRLIAYSGPLIGFPCLLANGNFVESPSTTVCVLRQTDCPNDRRRQQYRLRSTCFSMGNSSIAFRQLHLTSNCDVKHTILVLNECAFNAASGTMSTHEDAQGVALLFYSGSPKGLAYLSAARVLSLRAENVSFVTSPTDRCFLHEAGYSLSTSLVHSWRTLENRGLKLRAAKLCCRAKTPEARCKHLRLVDSRHYDVDDSQVADAVDAEDGAILYTAQFATLCTILQSVTFSDEHDRYVRVLPDLNPESSIFTDKDNLLVLKQFLVRANPASSTMMRATRVSQEDRDGHAQFFIVREQEAKVQKASPSSTMNFLDDLEEANHFMYEGSCELFIRLFSNRTVSIGAEADSCIKFTSVTSEQFRDVGVRNVLTIKLKAGDKFGVKSAQQMVTLPSGNATLSVSFITRISPLQTAGEECLLLLLNVFTGNDASTNELDSLRSRAESTQDILAYIRSQNKICVPQHFAFSGNFVSFTELLQFGGFGKAKVSASILAEISAVNTTRCNEITKGYMTLTKAFAIQMTGRSSILVRTLKHSNKDIATFIQEPDLDVANRSDWAWKDGFDSDTAKAPICIKGRRAVLHDIVKSLDNLRADSQRKGVYDFVLQLLRTANQSSGSACSGAEYDKPKRSKLENFTIGSFGLAQLFLADALTNETPETNEREKLCVFVIENAGVLPPTEDDLVVPPTDDDLEKLKSIAEGVKSGFYSGQAANLCIFTKANCFRCTEKCVSLWDSNPEAPSAKNDDSPYRRYRETGVELYFSNSTHFILKLIFVEPTNANNETTLLVTECDKWTEFISTGDAEVHQEFAKCSKFERLEYTGSLFGFVTFLVYASEKNARIDRLTFHKLPASASCVAGWTKKWTDVKLATSCWEYKLGGTSVEALRCYQIAIEEEQSLPACRTTTISFFTSADRDTTVTATLHPSLQMRSDKHTCTLIDQAEFPSLYPDILGFEGEITFFLVLMECICKYTTTEPSGDNYAFISLRTSDSCVAEVKTWFSNAKDGEQQWRAKLVIKEELNEATTFTVLDFFEDKPIAGSSQTHFRCLLAHAYKDVTKSYRLELNEQTCKLVDVINKTCSHVMFVGVLASFVDILFTIRGNIENVLARFEGIAVSGTTKDRDGTKGQILVNGRYKDDIEYYRSVYVYSHEGQTLLAHALHEVVENSDETSKAILDDVRKNIFSAAFHLELRLRSRTLVELLLDVHLLDNSWRYCVITSPDGNQVHKVSSVAKVTRNSKIVRDETAKQQKEKKFCVQQLHFYGPKRFLAIRELPDSDEAKLDQWEEQPLQECVEHLSYSGSVFGCIRFCVRERIQATDYGKFTFDMQLDTRINKGKGFSFTSTLFSAKEATIGPIWSDVAVDAAWLSFNGDIPAVVILSDRSQNPVDPSSDFLQKFKSALNARAVKYVKYENGWRSSAMQFLLDLVTESSDLFVGDSTEFTLQLSVEENKDVDEIYALKLLSDRSFTVTCKRVSEINMLTLTIFGLKEEQLRIVVDRRRDDTTEILQEACKDLCTKDTHLYYSGCAIPMLFMLCNSSARPKTICILDQPKDFEFELLKTRILYDVSETFFHCEDSSSGHYRQISFISTTGKGRRKVVVLHLSISKRLPADMQRSTSIDDGTVDCKLFCGEVSQQVHFLQNACKRGGEDVLKGLRTAIFNPLSHTRSLRKPLEIYQIHHFKADAIDGLVMVKNHTDNNETVQEGFLCLMQREHRITANMMQCKLTDFSKVTKLHISASCLLHLLNVDLPPRAIEKMTVFDLQSAKFKNVRWECGRTVKIGNLTFIHCALAADNGKLAIIEENEKPNQSPMVEVYSESAKFLALKCSTNGAAVLISNKVLPPNALLFYEALTINPTDVPSGVYKLVQHPSTKADDVVVSSLNKEVSGSTARPPMLSVVSAANADSLTIPDVVPFSTLNNVFLDSRLPLEAWLPLWLRESTNTNRFRTVSEQKIVETFEFDTNVIELNGLKFTEHVLSKANGNRKLWQILLCNESNLRSSKSGAQPFTVCSQTVGYFGKFLSFRTFLSAVEANSQVENLFCRFVQLEAADMEDIGSIKASQRLWTFATKNILLMFELRNGDKGMVTKAMEMTLGEKWQNGKPTTTNLAFYENGKKFSPP